MNYRLGGFLRCFTFKTFCKDNKESNQYCFHTNISVICFLEILLLELFIYIRSQLIEQQIFQELGSVAPGGGGGGGDFLLLLKKIRKVSRIT